VAVCAALLLTLVLTLQVYIGPLLPTKYWENATACLQHKQGATTNGVF